MNREDIKVIIGLIDRRIRESNLQLTAGSGGIASFLLHTKLRDMPSAVVADHDGRYYTETELGSTQVGEGASLIGIYDAGGYFDAVNIEDALQAIVGSGLVVTSLAKLGDGTLFRGDVKLIEGSGITIIRDDVNHGFEFISTGGGISDIEIQEDDVKVADVTIINFEGGGGKVTDEGGGKVTIDITGGAGLYSDYIHIRDEKAANTLGGGFTQDAWRTRDLTIELDDTGGDAALAGNQITLEAGTYRCLISCPAYSVDRHKARLQNITDAITELVGTSEMARNDQFATTRTFVVGRFTLASQKVLEVQHYCQTTQADWGFGGACNFGVIEVYTEVEFWKEA